MISAADVACLPYTPDLSAGGIAYACRSLSHVLEGRTSALSHRLPRLVAATAVELAFRRYLSDQGIPFDIRRAAPFTDADRFDVVLGGNRCEIRPYLISRGDQIAAIQADPGVILTAPALVPLDQHWLEGQSGSDLFLFAFVTGRIAPSGRDVQQAVADDEPVFLIHPMPKAWSRPRSWLPLAPLVLKSDCRQPVWTEIGGQDSSREFLVRAMELQPRTRQELVDDFHSVSYLHVKSRPGGRLGVYSRSRGEIHLAGHSDWMNIWVDGLDIRLVGWTTRRNFHERATRVPEGSRVFQFSRTRTKNLAIPVSELRPIRDLLDRVRNTRPYAG
jgi:hypothetical protein